MRGSLLGCLHCKHYIHLVFIVGPRGKNKKLKEHGTRRSRRGKDGGDGDVEEVPMESYTRADCFKVEKNLLVYGSVIFVSSLHYLGNTRC